MRGECSVASCSVVQCSAVWCCVGSCSVKLCIEVFLQAKVLLKQKFGGSEEFGPTAWMQLSYDGGIGKGIQNVADKTKLETLSLGRTNKLYYSQDSSGAAVCCSVVKCGVVKCTVV